MPGYCGKCNKEYDGSSEDHECDDGGWVESGSLEDYHRQTGDTGLVQAPDGFDWDEALRHGS